LARRADTSHRTRPFFLFLALLPGGVTPRDSVAGQSLSQLSEYSAGKLADSLGDEKKLSPCHDDSASLAGARQ